MIKKEKETLFGSFKQVQIISKCYHEWKPKRRIIFGYMIVFAKCLKCETWCGPPEGYKYDGWLVLNVRKDE